MENERMFTNQLVYKVQRTLHGYYTDTTSVYLGIFSILSLPKHEKVAVIHVNVAKNHILVFTDYVNGRSGGEMMYDVYDGVQDDIVNDLWYVMKSSASKTMANQLYKRQCMRKKHA